MLAIGLSQVFIKRHLRDDEKHGIKQGEKFPGHPVMKETCRSHRKLGGRKDPFRVVWNRGKELVLCTSECPSLGIGHPPRGKISLGEAELLKETSSDLASQHWPAAGGQVPV